MKESTANETIRCNNCGTVWPEDELDQIHDFWGSVSPGDVMPIGQCPNPECRALCYPPYGYVYGLEQQCASLRDVLTRLLEWEQAMGGWEAPVWDEARRVLKKDDASRGDMQSDE